jgi:hypothetical protein
MDIFTVAREIDAPLLDRLKLDCDGGRDTTRVYTAGARSAHVDYERRTTTVD